MGLGLVKPHGIGRRVLSLVLVCVMVWSLLPQRASALKPLCGIEAHEHTRECYAVSGGRELACDYMKYVHTHDESCYGSDGSLICMTADFVLHKHGESCYDSDGNLICPLEERDESVHGMPDYDSHPDATCIYVPYFGHVHSDACYRTETRLACGIEAGSGGHVHDGNCYERRLTCGYDDTGDDMAALVDTEHEPDSDGDLTVSDGAEADAGNTPVGTAAESGADAGAGGDGDLIDAGEPGASGDDESEGQDGGAGIPEVPAAHVHDGSCWSDVLVCDQDEGGHVHDGSCYEIERILACPYADSGNDDGAVSDGNTCVHYVYEEHVHDGSCYDGQGNVICGKWELKRHEHNSTCFRDIVESYGDELTCGKQEHTHSLKCYYDDETSPLGRFVTAYEAFDSGIKSGRWDLVSDAGEIAGEAYAVRVLSEGLDREILGMSETKDMLANLEKYIPDGFEPAAPEAPVEPDAGGNLNSDRSGAVLSVPVSHVARPDVVDEFDESAGFVFAIELSDGDASGVSVPEDATCRVSGSGEGRFGDIIFTAPGEYAFDVRALSGGGGTCRLDGRTFRVRATVTEAVSDGLPDADGSSDEAPDALSDEATDASVEFDVSVSYSAIGDDGSETSVDSISFESVDAVRIFLDAVSALRDAVLSGLENTEDLADACMSAMADLNDSELELPEVVEAIQVISSLSGGGHESFDDAGEIVWGLVDVDGVAVSDDANGVRTWDVSGGSVRTMNLRVQMNVNLDAGMEWLRITMPMRIVGAGRWGTDPLLYIQPGVSGNCTTEISEDGSTVTLTYTNPDGSGLHFSRALEYRTDCWSVKSGETFTLPCTISTPGGDTEYNLKGRVVTDFDMTVGPYSRYDSFSGFCGADLDNAYVQQWNQSYFDYFGISEGEFDLLVDSGYVLDIASFLIQPTGNQPYDIQARFSPYDGGELCAAVYMLDPRTDPGKECIRADIASGGRLAIPAGADRKVVTGNLADTTDAKTYVLYGLIKYEKSKVSYGNGNIRLYTDFEVTHVGADSGKAVTRTVTRCKLYEGALASYTGGEGFYAATYSPSAVTSSSGLSSLKAGYDASVDFVSDFFCLNEARPGFDGSGDADDLTRYRMEAVVDYPTVGSSAPNAVMNPGDYNISAYRLSLVDAHGSWSKTSDGNLNIGWFGFDRPDWSENVYVYGSRSMSGEGDWELLDTVPVQSVWAVNGDRGFPSDYVMLPDGIARLKVTYDSRLTAALRVGYRMELRHDGPNLSSLVAGAGDSITLMHWLRYTAYAPNGSGGWRRDLEFPIYAVSDGWQIVKSVREFDRAYPADGYSGLSADESANGYPCRNFVTCVLEKTDDSAGMVLGRTLYGRSSDGGYEVVGNRVANPNTDSFSLSDCYAHQDSVDNLKEVVYSIAGAVVSGANNLQDLQKRIRQDKDAGITSAYTSMRQRFYVLLPEGLKLRTSWDGNDGNKCHVSNGAASAWYIGTGSSYYAGDTVKTVFGGVANTIASDVSVPGLSATAGGTCHQMYFGAIPSENYRSDGDVPVVATYGVGNRQLVVFERTIDSVNGESSFDIWGPNQRFFWGRGLSFSAVPVNDGEALPSGRYTAEFWCQFLDGSGNPIAVDGYSRAITDDAVSSFNRCARSAGFDSDDGSTLLYISSTFTNRPALGGSYARLRVRPGTTGFYNTYADLVPEDTYSYSMTYGSDGIDTSDVVLWSNMENCGCGRDIDWQGRVTGIDLNGNTDARVYVNSDTFDKAAYAGKAESSWLSDPPRGWTEIDPGTYDGWVGVKSIAVWFGDRVFSDAGQNQATVYVHMSAPSASGIDWENGEPAKGWDGEPIGDGSVTCITHNELLFSDTHYLSGELQKGCAAANVVDVTVTGIPVTGGLQLPGTGGPGPGGYYKYGVAFLALACLLAINRDKTGRKRYFC